MDELSEEIKLIEERKIEEDECRTDDLKTWKKGIVAADSYGAYGPDLQGFVAIGETREETEELIY